MKNTDQKRKSSTPRGLTQIGKALTSDNGMSSKLDPATATTQSLQYDLWSTFWGLEKDHQSNSVEFWDALPKFSVHRNRQLEMRNEYGGLGVYRKTFFFRGEPFQLALQPALIAEDGKDIAYYPSSDEELVWEVLVKAFSDQQYGVHYPGEDPPSSFVRFSLRMIQRELGKHGHKRSISQIRKAVEILSRSVLIVSKQNDKKPLYRAPILADVADVTRDDYLEDPTRYWVARLPALISQSLKTLEYRQFNYSKSLYFKDRLAAWLQKRVTHRFTNASVMTSYHLSLTTIDAESGYFNDEKISRKIARIDRCIKEMSKAKIICNANKTIEQADTRGKPIVEVVWELYPHPEHVSEVKAANGRLKDAKTRLSLVSSQEKIAWRGTGRKTISN